MTMTMSDTYVTRAREAPNRGLLGSVDGAAVADWLRHEIGMEPGEAVKAVEQMRGQR